MTPPTIAALERNFSPMALPKTTPTAEMVKVVQPIMTAGRKISFWSMASDTPTARASMEVAMASFSIVKKAREAVRVFSSFLRDSLIMLKPIITRRAKAIQ